MSDTPIATPLKHSFSSIKDFQGCARRFHQVRILRNYKQEETEAMRYGTEVHKAFELYLTESQPLPAPFVKFKRFVDPLAKFNGKILCEQKMGIREDFTPCGFFDDDVWFRGIPDYLALDEEFGVARVGDFKTGKSSRFADTSQLELMAAMVMLHYPKINKVKGALLFIVANDVIMSVYTRDQLPGILSKWVGYADQINKAIDSDVWNPKPSGLCKFCPVSAATCEYR